ncbi:conserved hypothetical protein [Desulfamplus magnetovallimortis]|uniref:Magnesium transporter MgtE intracellular domain-containing protein n=1 Tax=Desulfamplus magnetovallimortis TaxID=1246637 RepID=A0A1W1HA20_9BACT|nr:conserved hypothetical protein [Desulfamplus magnetovallimortis]
MISTFSFAADGDQENAGDEVQTGQDTKSDEAPKEGEEGGDVDPNAPPPCPECPDPAKVVLIGLEDKKKALLAEEEALKEERKALEKFKEEIDENLERLEALKKQIQDDLAMIQKVKSDEELAQERAKEAEFEKKMTHMASVYAKMAPESAGAVLSQMDIKVASEIISRIAERKASKILEHVDKEQAAKISERLAHRKE